ncbi:transcriptional regulator domain-containing protein [Jannaschia rubra]|uniref:transcriptional regulator domain-containing protein n=1 Tax=Jannaschia rubra TaxID=282197 RepID=UPI003CD0D85F
MTQTGAWRIPARYRYALDIDDAAFAWEFLRRNPEFRENADRSKTHDQNDADEGPSPDPPRKTRRKPPESPHRADTVARWGLYFRAGPASARRRDHALLAA